MFLSIVPALHDQEKRVQTENTPTLTDSLSKQLQYAFELGDELNFDYSTYIYCHFSLNCSMNEP